MELLASSFMRRFFKCQDCGALNTDLTYDQQVRYLACTDRNACELMQEFNEQLGE